MGDRGSEALRGVDVRLHAGEIVGLAGVSGNGQRELAECLAGMRKPTAGTILASDIDITAATLNQRVAAGMAYIHQCLLRQRDEGTAILLISEDLDEILALSDRIAVMYEGRIVGIVERGQETLERIGLMMAGGL